MHTVTSIYSEKPVLANLSRFLQDNRIVLRPKTLEFLSVLWPTLEPPDQENLLTSLKTTSQSIVQPNEDYIVTLHTLKDILLELKLITPSESQSNKLLARNLAKKEFWKEAWNIVQLDQSEDSELTMLEWISRMKIKLQNDKKSSH